MTNVLIKHKVDDFTTWKTEFDNFASFRKTGGEKSYRVMQTTDDPNNVIVFLEWESMDSARKFLGSNELKDAMGKAGVNEAPTIHFLNEASSGAL